MVGSTGTIMSMRFVRSKLRKREESSHPVRNGETPTHVVSTQNHLNATDPAGFRQSPSTVWVFPPLPPQPNLYIPNATSLVSITIFYNNFFNQTKVDNFKTKKSQSPFPYSLE
jgi:hypothetical protein